MDSVDTVVVGAGIVGLAVARALAQSGREVWILEAEDRIGTGISSRHSEVLHAGLYYPPHSHRAALCVRGNRMAYAYAASRHLGHRRCGKLVVACHDDEVQALQALQRRAEANGVADLTWLDPAEARALEPEVACVAALWSPSTGIIDSHAWMNALLADAEAAGAQLVCRAPVLGGTLRDGAHTLRIGEGPTTLRARELVLSAGLGTWAILSQLDGWAAERTPGRHLCKARYLALDGGPLPFSRLVYPMPTVGGLGVHFTLDLAGRGRFGPDAVWQDAPDLSVEAGLEEAFVTAVSRYWPGVRKRRLLPAYAGIRPRLYPRGAPASDFVIDGAAGHGHAGLVVLAGIESPGMTASMAIAETVVARLDDQSASNMSARPPSTEPSP